jgi:hypothetical protein
MENLLASIIAIAVATAATDLASRLGSAASGWLLRVARRWRAARRERRDA